MTNEGGPYPNTGPETIWSMTGQDLYEIFGQFIDQDPWGAIDGPEQQLYSSVAGVIQERYGS